MSPALSATAQLLLLALEVYRNHHNKPPEWTPTAADWAALKSEVSAATIEQLHADAAARRQPGS